MIVEVMKGSDLMERERISVIICRPGERARVEEIDDDIEVMEKIVGGTTEEYMPFRTPRYDPDLEDNIEDIALICDRYARQKNLERNRAIRDSEGRVEEIIHGPFILCYAPVDCESYLPMPPELESELMKEFELPERFVVRNGEKRIERFEPGQIGDIRDLAR